MKSKTWMVRNDDGTAVCLLCGGISRYKFLLNWIISPTGITRNFLYWNWWKNWKKFHSKCEKLIV